MPIQTVKSKVGKYDVPITLDLGLVLTTLPAEFDLHLARCFIDDQTANKTLVALLLDDLLMYRLIKYFAKDSSITDDELDALASNDLDQFRQDFWAAYVAFSPPLRRPMMQESWEMAKISLKSAMNDSLSSSSTPSPGE